MPKQLKKWNGRAQGGKKGTAFVAAYSQKQAAELLNKAFNCCYVNTNEIRVYFSPMWGRTMEGINPEGPCVYWQEHSSKPVKKLI